MVWAAWNGILANRSVPGNIIHVRSLESWLPHVVHTSFTKGLDSGPPISFIIDSKGDGTLVFVVRALFLSAVSASLFPFLTLSFSTSYIFIKEISNPSYPKKVSFIHQTHAHTHTRKKDIVHLFHSFYNVGNLSRKKKTSRLASRQ